MPFRLDTPARAQGNSLFLLALTGLAAALAPALSGCASLRTQAPAGRPGDFGSASLSGQATGQAIGTEEEDEAARDGVTGRSGINEKGEMTILGVQLKNTDFDFPITLNSRVEFWVNYFNGRGRPHFERYLERSEYFIPYIRPILKQAGMPEDLVYLAMIESGFNNHARSHAKAVGPWQFISATGKRYGLMVNWWVDERRDTRKSTLAAVEYLRELFQMFNSWELAAAAYNAGEAKIARGIRRYGTKDFWALSRHRFLRQETRDYVPKIIAAAIVAKNRTQFGFPAPRGENHEGEVQAGDGEWVKLEPSRPGVDEAQSSAEGELSRMAESSAETGAARESLTKILAEDSWEDAEIPEDQAPLVQALSAPEMGVGGETARPVATPHVGKNGEVRGEQLTEFELQSPADLLKVARAAGLSYQTVKALNPEILRWCTPPLGPTYRIKLPTTVKERFLSAYNHPAFPRRVQFLAYRVKRGETLSNVARRFGIKPDPMADLNRVSVRSPLREGVRVLLPMPDDRTRSIASLEVKDAPEKRRFRKQRKVGSKSYRVSLQSRAAARSPSKRSLKTIQ
ncbi:MAG: transglycosylase SLT domain-containing protein [Oligoflexia bacterium]